MSFISAFAQALLQDPAVYDFSDNFADSGFQLVVLRKTPAAIEFVAAVAADGLREQRIVELRDAFFAIIRRVSYHYSARPYVRKPNGVLLFVFEQGCPDKLATFIKTQTKITHWSENAVMVSWSIDLQKNIVHTHRNPVSILPPTFIVSNLAFPSVGYVKTFMGAYLLGKASVTHEPNANAEKLPKAQVRMSALRQILEVFFDDNELRDLCFDLGIDYESLPGVGKSAKARELVAYAGRHQRMDELVALCRRLRPGLDV